MGSLEAMLHLFDTKFSHMWPQETLVCCKGCRTIVKTIESAASQFKPPMKGSHEEPTAALAPESTLGSGIDGHREMFRWLEDRLKQERRSLAQQHVPCLKSVWEVDWIEGGVWRVPRLDSNELAAIFSFFLLPSPLSSSSSSSLTHLVIGPFLRLDEWFHCVRFYRWESYPTQAHVPQER